MIINISVTKAELLFMREASEEKFKTWMEELGNAEDEHDIKTHFDKQHQYSWKPVQPEEAVVAKKPHWTHTAKGKKILAARKRNKK